ncbi:MAG: CoA transferase, partial [Dehalococcoidia bacterium]
AGDRLTRLADMLGHPDWLKDPKWFQPSAAFDPDLVEEFNQHLDGWLMQRGKREVWAEARRAKVLCGPLFTVEEVFADPHFHERGFWQDVTHPEMGSVTLPGRPFIMSESPWEIRRPAPLLGEHTAELLSEAGGRRESDVGAGAALMPATADDPGSSSPVPSPSPSPQSSTIGPEATAEIAGVRHPTSDTRHPTAGTLPLKGVRVLDFCVVWAGPFATMLLGDLGAEVIKPENPYVMQPSTRSGLAHPPKEILRAPGYRGAFPNNELGPRPWNYAPTMVQLYRNKLSFSVDWRRPEGKEILARLVAKSDVVFENNAPGTMEKLGLSYERLKQINPEIIMLRAPAYGSSGPYADARALGVHMESVVGHTLLRGYRDRDPSTTTSIFAADYMTGPLGSLAVMLALWHRKQTGKGQLIELGQAEGAAGLLFQAYMDYSLNRRLQSRLGNRSLYDAAPSGVYPCRSPGSAAEAEDRWIAITVTNDGEWAALRQVMGEPAWAQTAELATASGRAAKQDHLDAMLAGWTAGFDDYELFHRLQAVGVAAAPVLEASRLYDDPQVQARGTFQAQKLYDLERRYRLLTPFYRFPETPATVYQPPMAMGEHNDYVYKQVIGVSDAEYERLKEDGHIAMDYDPAVP